MVRLFGSLVGSEFEGTGAKLDADRRSAWARVLVPDPAHPYQSESLWRLAGKGLRSPRRASRMDWIPLEAPSPAEGGSSAGECKGWDIRAAFPLDAPRRALAICRRRPMPSSTC